MDLPVTIQLTTSDKLRWADGLLIILDRDGLPLGGSASVEETASLKAPWRQFKKLPAVEVVTVLDSGKSSSAAAFYSTKQVKYYSAEDKLRVLAARAVRLAGKIKISKVYIPLENAGLADIQNVIQGAEVAGYSFNRYKSTLAEKNAITVTLGISASLLKEVQATLKQETVLDGSVTFARDLVNEIPQELYPERLAEQARKAATAAGLKVTVYDERRLAKENFNGILTVGRGSNRPPRLVVMRHAPAKAGKVHLALVGKAITFDTGGHSLKQAKGMWEMKGDMAGGAAVIGAMLAIGRLKPGIEVTGIVPSALNAIGPDAVLPGDIIRSRSGKTVHVDNTDAEGRLILMDALNLAQELGATHIVDVATLTGSIVRALGEAMAGLFANDDDWAEAVRKAGARTGEDFWRMPLIQEYREGLDHPVADIDNVGKSINAGAIVAGLFLQEFVSDSVKWAHLDIAGVGLYTKSYKQFGPGGSGFGVRTLTQLALDLAAAR